MLRVILLFIFPIVLFSQTIISFKSENMDIVLKKVISFDGIPWGITFLDDKKMLFSIKEGYFALLDLNTKNIKYINPNLNVLLRGQGGLLDVQKSPNFKKDNTIYFTYVKNINGKGATTLAKAKFLDETFVDIKDIFITKSRTSTSRHFGSRITFDEKNHLYFSIGDRGERANGQDLTTHAGSIIRLNLDGTIPKDNPFIDDKKVLDEIYSFGHRNPQGLFYDKVSKQLISCEHGPRGGDEINIIKKGLNYGWATISYGKEYWNPLPVGEGTHKEGMQQPIKVYIPSIAPSSLLVYHGEEFKNWKGDIFIGALKLTHINRIILDNNTKVKKEQRLLEKLNERIRNIIQDKRGIIYLSTDSGSIYSLSKKED